MKRILASAVFLFSFAASSQSDVARSLDHSREMIKGWQIGRVEILRIPDDVVTRIAVTPEMLRKSPSYMVLLRSGFERELGSLLSGVSAVNSKKQSDLRWGLILVDQSGKEFESVFVDHFGTTGYVNGQAVEFTVNMSKRLKEFVRDLR